MMSASASRQADGRDDVRAYYRSFGEREWARLANPEDGALEFALTCHAVRSYAPPVMDRTDGQTGGPRVLDIGGGPGRYALWLAGLGHQVTLADLSP